MKTAVINNSTYDWSYYKLRSRNNFLFAAGAAAVITGFLFPGSVRILDIFLIFTLCLTGAVPIIAHCTNKISEVSGFPALIVLTVCTQITSAIASSKLLISEGAVSLLISVLARFNVIGLYASDGLVLLLSLVLSVAVFVISCRFAKNSLNKNKEFFETILAAKKAKDNKFAEHIVISSEENQEDKNTDKEVNFFLAGSAVSKFIFCCSLILLVVSFANMLACVISLTASDSAITPANALTGSIGFQCLTLLTIFGVFHLLKNTGPASIEDSAITEEQYKQRIKVVAREIASSENYIPINETAQCPDRRIDMSTAEQHYDGELWSAKQVDNENGYQTITELITNSDSKTILLAASATEQLPVTIPVNISIHLTQSSKVLLIDCDLQRQAVLQVFDIKEKPSEPLSSCVKNLWIGLPDCLNAKNAETSDKFDYIVIYAPRIRNLNKAKHLLRYSQRAILFGQPEMPRDNDMKTLLKVLGNLNCYLLEPHENLVAV